MISKKSKNLLAALDIGTSKVIVIIAKPHCETNYEIMGIGQSESKGLKKGVIVNIESTIHSIQSAREKAELMARCKINNVFTCISGHHIRSFNSSGIVAIREKKVTQADVIRAIEIAKAIHIPANQQILHVITQKFIIDDHNDVQEPIGMNAVRLEVKVHIITSSISEVQNIVECINSCGLKVNTIVLQALASSIAVLNEDERKLGTVLVNIGAGTTDVIIFSGGIIRYTEVIPIGGNQVTNDIAIALNIPTIYAENIKLTHGFAKQILANPEKIIELPDLTKHKTHFLSQIELASIVEPRIEELFLLVNQIIYESGCYNDLLLSGVVLTGGASMMHGMLELSKEIFLKPVRLGTPNYSDKSFKLVCNPQFSTVMGLLYEEYIKYMYIKHNGYSLSVNNNYILQTWQQIKKWFVNIF